MPGHLLARRLQAPGDLLGGMIMHAICERAGKMTVAFTSEQRAAIEHRDGDLLLDASAGAGKTTVLVERFVRSVLQSWPACNRGMSRSKYRVRRRA